MPKKTTTAQVQKEVAGNTVLSFSKPTPMWATWMFRIVFLLGIAASGIVAGDDAIEDKTKIRIMLYLNAGSGVVWGVARGLGVEKKAFENEG